MVPVMAQPSKEAMPLTAVTEPSVQARVPDPLATARATEALESVTVLPLASWTVTTGWVVKAAPLAAPPGWVVTDSLAAAPKPSVNESVVALARLPLVAVSV